MIIDFIITIYFYIAFIITTFVNFLLAPAAFVSPPVKKLLHNSLSIFSKLLLLFISGSYLQQLNKININKKEPYLIICNHQSLFDIIILFSLLSGKIQFKWIIKKSLFQIPVFGTMISSAGYINLDRDNKYKAYKAIKKAINYINNNISIAIFPEGTRSLTDTIQKFKAGSMVIATNSGCKILPIVLKNTLHIKSKNSFFIRPIPIKVKFLKPFTVNNAMKKDKKKILDTLRKNMLKEYKKM